MVDLDGELELGGCTVRYSDSRLGRRPVVLLHGAGADRRMFAVQRDALIAAGFRVILLDLRGHGCSRPNTRRWTSTLLADRAELVRTFSAMSKAEFFAAWRATTQFVAPDPAYRTPVPLLLLRGAEDATGNIATAMPRWAAAEGVTEVVVPGAGHVLTLDAPGVVSDALLTFLASTESRHA